MRYIGNFGGGGGGGGGTIDTVARTASTANTARLNEVSPQPGSAVTAGETYPIAGGLWTAQGNGTTPNPLTAAALAADPNFEPFEGGATQVDEVVISTTDLTGAVPAGAKIGFNITTGAQFRDNAGTWAAIPGGTDTSFRSIPIARVDAVQDVAPTALEFPSPGENERADVRLSDGVEEAWLHNGTTWLKVFTRPASATSVDVTRHTGPGPFTAVIGTLNVVPVGTTFTTGTAGAGEIQGPAFGQVQEIWTLTEEGSDAVVGYVQNPAGDAWVEKAGGDAQGGGLSYEGPLTANKAVSSADLTNNLYAVVMDTAAAALTVTIDAGLPDGTEIEVSRIGANQVVVASAGAETFTTSSASGPTLELQVEGHLRIKKAGTDWRMISGGTL